MANNKTNFLEDALINEVLRNIAYTPAATVYVALFTAAPGEAGGGTEVSGNAYARQSIAFDAPSPAGETQNTSIITFPAATPSAWGTITDFAIFDALTVGNMLYYGTLDASVVINADDQFKFAAGAVQVDEL